MDHNFIPAVEDYFIRLKSTLDRISRDELQNFLKLLVQALEGDKNIFIMGNGGSGATASHFAGDFNKGLSFKKARRFRFMCLNDNFPTLGAYANDVSYEDVFVEQLKNFLQPGDLVIAISGSGNSPNVIKAIEYANAQGAISLGLTGYDGGRLKKLASHGVHIPAADMQITEDLHMVLDHMAYAVLGAWLPGENPQTGKPHG